MKAVVTITFIILFISGLAISIVSSKDFRTTLKLAKKRVFIIHGYGASPSDHWFPWLKKELSVSDIEVTVIEMPSPSDPQSEEWLNKLDSKINYIDENTFFVAHSLGCITLLNYLDSLNIDQIEFGGMVLVSGFVSKLDNLPELDGFINEGIDFEAIVNSTESRVVIGALDDPIVSHEYTKELSKILDADLVLLEEGGHFLGSNGYTQLPVALNKIKGMINQQTN